MASFGSALTLVLLGGGTAAVNHLNNPVYVGSRTPEDFVGPIPVRVDRASDTVDVWETFSDTDILSTQWTQADGAPIPEPAEGTFGWAFDAMREAPNQDFRPVGYKPGMAYFFDGSSYRLRLTNGLIVRPAFPAREMRGQWERA